MFLNIQSSRITPLGSTLKYQSTTTQTQLLYSQTHSESHLFYSSACSAKEGTKGQGKTTQTKVPLHSIQCLSHSLQLHRISFRSEDTDTSFKLACHTKWGFLFFRGFYIKNHIAKNLYTVIALISSYTTFIFLLVLFLSQLYETIFFIQSPL